MAYEHVTEIFHSLAAEIDNAQFCTNELLCQDAAIDISDSHFGTGQNA